MLLDGMVGTVGQPETGSSTAPWPSAATTRWFAETALDVKAFIAVGIRVSGVAAGPRLVRRGHRASASSSESVVTGSLAHAGHPPVSATGGAAGKRLIWRGELAAAETAVRTAIAAAEDAGPAPGGDPPARSSLTDVLVRSGRIDEARAVAAAQEDQRPEPPRRPRTRSSCGPRSRRGTATRRRCGTGRSSPADRALQFGHVWIELEADRALAAGCPAVAASPRRRSDRLRGVFDRAVLAGVTRARDVPRRARARRGPGAAGPAPTKRVRCSTGWTRWRPSRLIPGAWRWRPVPASCSVCSSSRLCAGRSVRCAPRRSSTNWLASDCATMPHVPSSWSARRCAASDSGGWPATTCERAGRDLRRRSAPPAGR